MAPRHLQPRSVFGRPSTWLILALASAAIGCQSKPLTIPTPNVNPPANTTPSDTTASQTQPSDSSAADSASLPAASTDSDLEPDDQGAVENLLDSDEVINYLPSDLIHDGGVILFQTMALGSAGTRAETDPAQSPAAVPLTPPSMWNRGEVARGGRQAQLRKGKDAVTGDKLATVTVKYPMLGTLAYRDTTRGSVVRKHYRELFQRELRFRLTDSRWQLDAIAPIQEESQGGNSGITIDAVNLFAGAATTPSFSVASTDLWQKVGELSQFAPGETVRVEVKAHKDTAGPVFVYGHLVGGSDRNRQQLTDDGTNGDRVAGDGLYTSTFIVPATEGLRNLGIDVLDPSVFAPGGLYRSNALGLSFKVKAKS